MICCCCCCCTVVSLQTMRRPAPAPGSLFWTTAAAGPESAGFAESLSLSNPLASAQRCPRCFTLQSFESQDMLRTCTSCKWIQPTAYAAPPPPAPAARPPDAALRIWSASPRYDPDHMLPRPRISRGGSGKDGAAALSARPWDNQWLQHEEERRILHSSPSPGRTSFAPHAADLGAGTALPLLPGDEAAMGRGRAATAVPSVAARPSIGRKRAAVDAPFPPAPPGDAAAATGHLGSSGTPTARPAGAAAPPKAPAGASGASASAPAPRAPPPRAAAAPSNSSSGGAGSPIGRRGRRKKAKKKVVPPDPRPSLRQELPHEAAFRIDRWKAGFSEVAREQDDLQSARVHASLSAVGCFVPHALVSRALCRPLETPPDEARRSLPSPQSAAAAERASRALELQRRLQAFSLLRPAPKGLLAPLGSGGGGSGGGGNGKCGALGNQTLGCGFGGGGALGGDGFGGGPFSSGSLVGGGGYCASGGSLSARGLATVGHGASPRSDSPRSDPRGVAIRGAIGRGGGTVGGAVPAAAAAESSMGDTGADGGLRPWDVDPESYGLDGPSGASGESSAEEGEEDWKRPMAEGMGYSSSDDDDDEDDGSEYYYDDNDDDLMRGGARGEVRYACGASMPFGGAQAAEERAQDAAGARDGRLPPRSSQMLLRSADIHASDASVDALRQAALALNGSTVEGQDGKAGERRERSEVDDEEETDEADQTEEEEEEEEGGASVSQTRAWSVTVLDTADFAAWPPSHRHREAVRSGPL